MSKSGRSHEGQSLLASAPDKGLSDKGPSDQESIYGCASAKPTQSQEDYMFSSSGRRLYCLDVARIVCVGLVVVNHGGTSWSDQFGLWNEMYVQQWVLQWLFIICGMSFAMSSRNTIGYLARLMLYFVIGVFTNWCAFVIKGMDWRGQFWNVIFQFWFIFGLMMYIVVLTPLKRDLKWISARGPNLPPHQDFGLAHGVAVICFMLVAIHFFFKFALTPLTTQMVGHAMIALKNNAGAGAAFWGLPSDMGQSKAFMEELLGYIQVSIGSMAILHLFPRLSNRVSLTNWIVLLNVYTFRCLFVRGQFARIVDGLDFTMIGLANYYLGLSYRRTIGKYLTRYWFLMLFIFSLVIPPGTWGRFDEHTIKSMGFRIRYHVVELTLALLLLCAGERIADAAIFLEDKLEWLSWWALYLFLSHKFIHIVIPHPFNWIVLILLAPIAWAIHGGSGNEKSVYHPDGQPSRATPVAQDNPESAASEPSKRHADVENALQEAADRSALSGGADDALVLADPDSTECCPELEVSQIEGR